MYYKGTGTIAYITNGKLSILDEKGRQDFTDISVSEYFTEITKQEHDAIMASWDYTH